MADETLSLNRSSRHYGWELLLTVVVAGYLVLGRTFAYLGIPSLNLFIGEVVLALYTLFYFRPTVGRWPRQLLTRSPETLVGWTMLALLVYGVGHVLWDFTFGSAPLAILLKQLTFSYYPIYFWIGSWAARKNSLFITKVVRLVAWINGLYGIAYVLFLGRIPWYLPTGAADPVAVFGQPSGSAICILGLLAVEHNLVRLIPLLALNALVLMGVQVRAEWLGLLVGITVFCVLSKKMWRLFLCVAGCAAILAAAYLADISIPSPSTRGSSLSARSIVGRAVAAVDGDAAAKFSADAGFFAGTADFRTRWWRAIWDSAHENQTRAVFGHGYGYQLTGLVDYVRDRSDLRSPHSWFFYALGYGGWSEVVLFALMQVAIGATLLGCYRNGANAYGLGLWAIGLTSASLGNYFETPFGAIPFYILVGALSVPIFRASAPIRSIVYRSVSDSPAMENVQLADLRIVFR